MTILVEISCVTWEITGNLAEYLRHKAVSFPSLNNTNKGRQHFLESLEFQFVRRNIMTILVEISCVTWEITGNLAEYRRHKAAQSMLSCRKTGSTLTCTLPRKK